MNGHPLVYVPAALAFTGCSAESQGGQTDADDVTVKRDATPPTVTYGGNAGAYDASETVAITCTAADNLSGVATDTCADIAGAAWTFGLGGHAYSADATDNAGNAASGSTSFDVTVSYDGLCSLVEGSVTQQGVANSLCAKLSAAARANDRGQTNARDGSLNAFINEVGAQSGKKVPAAMAAVLVALAQALMS